MRARTMFRSSGLLMLENGNVPLNAAGGSDPSDYTRGVPLPGEVGSRSH
jgi:hypothetical protein